MGVQKPAYGSTCDRDTVNKYDNASTLDLFSHISRLSLFKLAIVVDGLRRRMMTLFLFWDFWPR